MTGPWERRRVRRRAGASAARQYQRYKREWQRSHRKLFMGLATAVGVVLVGTLLAARHHLFPYYAGFASGLLVAFYVLVRESPPTWIENYQVGAWGEERTAKVLEPLLSRGWVILHDLTRIKSNLDHVLVGPGGVFVLDTKNWVGTANANGDQLTLTRPDGKSGYNSQALAQQARRQGAELNRVLRQRSGLSPWVSAVVVLWADFPAGAVAGNRMSYVHGDHLVEWLSGQRACLNADQVAHIASALEPGQRRRSASQTIPAPAP